MPAPVGPLIAIGPDMRLSLKPDGVLITVGIRRQGAIASQQTVLMPYGFSDGRPVGGECVELVVA